MMSKSMYLFLDKFKGQEGLLKSVNSEYCTNRKSGLKTKKRIPPALKDFKHCVRCKTMCENDYKCNQAKYGNNEYPIKRTQTRYDLFMKGLSDQTLKILMAVSVLSIINGFADKNYKNGYLQGLCLLWTVFIVTLV